MNFLNFLFSFWMFSCGYKNLPTWGWNQEVDIQQLKEKAAAAANINKMHARQYIVLLLLVLTHISLIKVDDNDQLLMHDLLKNLGREIVRQEDLKVPKKHSRLWCPKIALDVVQTRKVNFIHSYCLHDQGNISLKFKVYSRMCSCMCCASRETKCFIWMKWK